MMKLLSCAIGLLLLTCGVVEAQDFVTTDCKLYDVNGHIHSTCEHSPLGETKVTCEVKMRAAMKAVAPFLSKNGDAPSSRLRMEADAIEREDAAVQQFRNVMKECVQ